MFKTIGLIIFPAICYYVYRKHGIKKSYTYFLFSVLFFLVISLPFTLIGGLDSVLYHIIGSPQAFQRSVASYSTLMSFYNIFRFITNININFIAIPVLFVSYLTTLLIIFVKKLKDIEIELFRNMALLWITTLVFGFQLIGTYNYFYLPFLFILFGFNAKKNIIAKKQIILGIFLIIISLLIYSITYREGLIQYSFFDRILLLVVVILAPLGVYNLLYNVKNNYRIIWIAIVIATIMSIEINAAPLLVFPLKNITDKLIDLNKFTTLNKLYGNEINGRTDVFFAYAIFYGGSGIMFWIFLILLYYTILKDKFHDHLKGNRLL
jgi:hypothetical protein